MSRADVAVKVNARRDRGQRQVGETRVCNVTTSECELPCTVLELG